MLKSLPIRAAIAGLIAVIVGLAVDPALGFGLGVVLVGSVLVFR